MADVCEWSSSFIFMDETGVLPAPRDRFFAVGMLKCPSPALIQRPLAALRDKNHFFVEMKWTDVRANNLAIYKQALDAFFACQTARFACFVADKTAHDPIAEFGNHWSAYERLASQLLVGNIGPKEHVVVLADEYSTPANVHFEGQVHNLVNNRLNAKHVTGVCRMRSTGVDLFQVLDLLLGAVAYEHKLIEGLIPAGTHSPKRKLLAYVRRGFGVASIAAPLRVTRFNAAVYK